MSDVVCQGCKHTVATSHPACLCPECGGPKDPSSKRCSSCAGRGATRGQVLDLFEPNSRIRDLCIVEPAPPRPETWVVTCWNCALETYPSALPACLGACLHCGGRCYAELLERASVSVSVDAMPEPEDFDFEDAA